MAPEVPFNFLLQKKKPEDIGIINQYGLTRKVCRLSYTPWGERSSPCSTFSTPSRPVLRACSSTTSMCFSVSQSTPTFS